MKINNKDIIFDNIGKKVLTTSQMQLIPILEEFSKTHFLGGGTAIALYLGHRKSIDFDFFSLSPQGTPKDFLKRLNIFNSLIDNDEYFREIVAMDMAGYSEIEDEYMIKCLGTICHFININRTLYKDQKISFHPDKYLDEGIRTISLIELAGMKVFAMMYRNKWKDAVDIYFILKQNSFSFEEIIAKSKEIYGELYKEEYTYETILRKTWDKTEQVEYLIQNPPEDTEIEDFLISEVDNILKKLKTFY